MKRTSLRAFLVLALAVAVGLGLALSPFASPSPDGLERVATDQGFLDDGETGALQEEAPAPGYAFPGIEDERLATAAAGFAGTLATFAIGWGLARALRSRPPGAPG